MKEITLRLSWKMLLIPLSVMLTLLLLIIVWFQNPKQLYSARVLNTQTTWPHPLAQRKYRLK